MATINAHLSESPPRLTGRRPGLPPAVDGVFAKVLAKSPGERFGSCGEFAGALRWALDAPGRPPTPPPARPRRRGIWVAVASGAVVAVAAVLTVFVLSGKPSPPTPVVSIGASSRNAPVGSDVYVYYQDGKYAGATISGNISRTERGEVARLTAQRFPFTSAPVVVGSSQITGKSQRVSFGVAPTLATRYQIEVFGSPSATTPLVRSAVQPVYVDPVFRGTITQNRTCRNRCAVTIRLRFMAPPAALQTEAAKHVYFYFAVNLSSSSAVSAPKTLYLQTNYTLSAPTILSSDHYQQTLSFWYASHNEYTKWNWFACTRDTESADGIGLPGHHGCGNSTVPVSVRSRGYIG